MAFSPLLLTRGEDEGEGFQRTAHGFRDPHPPPLPVKSEATLRILSGLTGGAGPEDKHRMTEWDFLIFALERL
jgi:hypothetical protein